MKLLILFFIIFSTNAFAEAYSMRSCMILPITDTAGNSLGYSVFERLEARIKSSGWCDYKSSSEVIEIFSKYRDRLPEYLQNDKVLRTVADRLKVGTMIRVGLKYEIDKLEIKLDIVGENGSDIYLSEKTIINEINADLATTTILNWLELYETIIPYDGKLLGVLGDQVTFRVAKSKSLSVGQEFKIKKLIAKKSHPLLKKVVEWDSVVVAKGKIFNLSKGQALGVIKTYMTDKKPKTGDWIKLEKFSRDSLPLADKYKRIEQNSFGRLGDFTLAFTLASHTTGTNAVTGNNKMGGYVYGVSTEVEAWITRNYIVIGEFSKRVGNLSSTSGSPDSDSSGQNITSLKIGGGYKFLPMGFFYGPQINIYAAYATHSYQMDTSQTDGFSTNSFSGIAIGVGGNIPLQRGLRIFGSGEIMPFGEFSDDEGTFGSSQTISSMNFEIGARYLWSPTMRLVGSFEVLNNSAKTSGANSEVSYSDSNFKVGAVFTF
jgi:hypothetical protein